MKKITIFLILGFLLFYTDISAQQDPQYTQYMYNMNVVNPAYAGSRGTLSLGLLARTQWTNVQGAPKTVTFSADAPCLKIVAHMYTKTKKLARKHNLKFTLEESPAESAARRLAKTDLVYFNREATDVVKGEDPDTIYYTNSIHLSADAPVSLVERIREQSKYHSMIESGAITHAFVGEEKPSAESIASLMKSVFFRTQSAQVCISPEFTYCDSCNHSMRGLIENCTRCGSDEVWGETRVVGYFSKIQNWNKSKRYGELVARQRGRYAVQTADDEISADDQNLLPQQA